jgi:hypothetical protein
MKLQPSRMSPFCIFLTVHTLEMYLPCKDRKQTSSFTKCNIFSAVIKPYHIACPITSVVIQQKNYVACYSVSTRAPAAKLKRRVVMTRAHFLAVTNALAG